MYKTLHTDGKTKGRINYTVWSEVFSCPECIGEIVFLDEALDKKTQKTRSAFPCPHCSTELTKDNLERSFETLVDPASGETLEANSPPSGFNQLQRGQDTIREETG